MNILSFKDSNENKLQLVIDILKNQIKQYNAVSDITKSRPQLKRLEKIQKLTSNERQLSTQFHQIRQEIQRYERKYEKLLKKKVKLMQVQIREDLQKLDIIKQSYRELNAQIFRAPSQIKQVKKNKSKKTNKPIKVQVEKSKFKQKNIQFKKRIRIRIKQNEKLDKREVHFIKDGNEQQAFTDLTKIVKPGTTNIRECKILLQKLTKEQVRQYMSERGSEQQKIGTMCLRQDQNQNVNKNDKPTMQLNWHIKIPKAVIEESEKENNSFEPNAVTLKKMSPI